MKLTERCNLACSYCYLDYSPERQGNMSLSIVRAVFRKAFAFCKARGKVDFIFHGGEPLLAGASRFSAMLRIQDAERQHARFCGQCWNGIQTNATLLNDEWVQIFLQRDLDVGVSLDYPRKHHDCIRHDAFARPTFDRTVRSIELLRSRGVRKLGVITVVSRENISYLPEMYGFFKQLGVGFRPNVYFPRSPDGITPQCVPPDSLGRHLVHLFDTWFSDDAPIHIDLFEDIIESMVRGRSRACTHLNDCADFVGIRPNGDAFICDRFTSPDFYLGNVMVDHISDFCNSRAAKRFTCRSAELKQCRQCEWFAICRGGCPNYAFSFTGSISVADYYCAARKELFAHIRNALEEDPQNAVDGTRADSD